MQIGICGKSNTGKTTFFSAATRVDAEISNRIFTTIKPNKGVGYVATPCVCKELGVTCNPVNSKCVNHTRLIPVKMIDIAGLVPGAHKGKGLGNAFLSDIMEANALIHVVDASGGTDEDGNPVQPGTHDPMEDVLFLEREMDYWILGILEKNWRSIFQKAKSGDAKLDDLLYKQLSGLGITHEDAMHALAAAPLNEQSTEEEKLKFIEILRKKSKPMIVAANKADVPGAEEKVKNMADTEVMSVPCSAESELALRKAQEEGDITYLPGDGKYGLIKPDLDEKKAKALEFIQSHVLDKYGSTGVQQTLNKAAFDLLKMIVVYPVQNESHYTSGKGNVLPDAYLVPKGTTAKQLAGIIHTEFAERFIAAVDARTKQRMAADHELKNNDIVKIMLRK
jgi:ribosome-binding ATPase YchF (GTP1/OBG family)